MSPGAPAEGAPSPAGHRAFSSRAVRALRAPKEPRDPWAPPPALLEEERLPGGGGTATALTVFLTGAECPFTCVFCDLWRHTLDGPTPPGALAAQLEAALAAHPGLDLPATVVKLYNASNFFDDRAVPPADRRALARRLAGARRVVVECHPRLVGAACFDFARELGGRSDARSDRAAGGAGLEVALGLETIHPGAFPRLGKGMELANFGSAAARLREGGIAVRAFVQVGLPFIPPGEAVDWAVASVAHALAAGAGQVALILTRGGNGALELLAERGDFTPPTLADLEQALERSLRLPGAGAGTHPGAVVTADLWDLERLARCKSCLPARRERLRRMNLTGEPAPAAACPDCGGGEID
ncbi:MAG TPA: radical SAM protein [Thermoanaerobaculia bacterium]|nr:radical SAM protein [Thermoanaerobaculia bacterium]